MAPRTPLTMPLRDMPGGEIEGDPVEVELWDDAPVEPGTIPQPDGGVVVDFKPYLNKTPRAGKFDANLADEMSSTELATIAGDLMTGIKSDDDSRQEWLAMHAEGIDMLGFKPDGARSSVSANAAPIDGMSSSKHPLLADACISFQAVARGEMLPADGPCKVRNDQPQRPAPPPFEGPSPFAPPPQGMPPQGPPVQAMPGAAPPGAPPMPPGPMPPQMGHNGGPPLPQLPPQPSNIPGVPMPTPGQNEKGDRDLLADALEKDFNHYLTTTATEYYPDTVRMLFGVGFGGQGIKKVYNCPLRRRPVSESIAMEDFIVSNALTDLRNAARITHRITMRQSVMRRMQLLGVYLDIDLGAPIDNGNTDPVKEAKADTMGVQLRSSRPEDAEYELYECYCELELDEFAPPQFRGKGLPLPYRVTIERITQTILEIRRNWNEDDKECAAKEFFVDFSYVKAFGFYGIGLLHILGNLTKTLTAIEREFIDSGMFASFPGFLFAKGAGRQLTNQFRVGPGQGVGLDVGLKSLAEAVQPLPYKDLPPAFAQFALHLEEMGRRLGGIANIDVGEGVQNAPVGTTLAQIEQATKPIGSVLKGLHASQARELQLLADRFREDPEAFWRFNKSPAMPWQKAQFEHALNDFNLVPVSDPNSPTHLHRMARASALIQIATTAPGLLNPQKVFKRVAGPLNISDPDELLAPPMPQEQKQPDPAKMATAQAKVQGDQLRAQTDLKKEEMQAQSKAAEMQSRIQLAMIEQETERLRLASTMAIHSDKAQAAMSVLNIKNQHDLMKQARDQHHEHVQGIIDRNHDGIPDDQQTNTEDT